MFFGFRNPKCDDNSGVPFPPFNELQLEYMQIARALDEHEWTTGINPETKKLHTHCARKTMNKTPY